ncbi:hypothetical protein FACS1894139_13210 [Planctomycetales bacterium]|nr:hypothetical protein FACS1894107_05020 [Planctomycetales bacterium]GHS99910.1 hypothetical protein FACS1894108_10830 [Planctomycetales bacterium]GHT06709.1 hypothetical protein FACS1894139_13210 [Planctomycetales bacterium]
MRLLLLILFLFAARGAAGGEILAEDKEPKRPLSRDERELSRQLRQEIAAEKARLEEIAAPLNALRDQMKAPTEELKTFGLALGAFDQFIAENADRRYDERTAKAIDKLARQHNLSPYAARVKSYLRMLAAQPDNPQLRRQRENMQKFTQNLTRAPQQQLDRLTEQRDQLRAQLRRENEKIAALRSRLDALYGYGAGGVAALELTAAPTAEEAKTRALLDHEIDFARVLVRERFADLAERHLARLSEQNPLTGQPYTATSANYLRQAAAELQAQRLLLGNNLRDKLAKMPAVVREFAAIRARLIPGSLAYYEAGGALLSAYFRCAENLLFNARLQMLADRSAYFFPGDDWFDENGRRAARGAAPEAAQFSDSDLALMSASAVNDNALKMAAYFYYQGLAEADALLAPMPATLTELADAYQHNSDPAAAKAQRELLEKFAATMLAMQHLAEAAWGQTAEIYPATAEQRDNIAKNAERYIGDKIAKSFWRDDYAPYAYWMSALGFQREPLVAADGKPAPRFTGFTTAELNQMRPEQRRQAEADVARYPYPSDRVARIFQRYFVESPAPRAARQLGWRAYAQALANIARAQYEIADGATGDAAAPLEHAEKLHADLMRVLTDANAAASPDIGELDEDTVGMAQTQIAAPYYLFRAARAVKLDDKNQATTWAQMALDAAAFAQTSADAPTRARGDEQTKLLLDFGKKNQLALATGNDDSKSLPLLVGEAERAYRDGVATERAGRAAAADFNRARAAYVGALAQAARLQRPSDRDRFVPRCLYRLAAIAKRLQDDDAAFVAAALLVQEFRDDFAEKSRNYPAAEFPGARAYFPAALNLLRDTARRRVQTQGTDASRRDYIDALEMCVRYGNEHDDYLRLIDACKAGGQLTQAIKLIAEMSPTNDRYVLLQLFGATLWLEREREIALELETAKNPAATPEELTRARAQTLALAQKFIDLHAETAALSNDGATLPEKRRQIFLQEKNELSDARFMPLLAANAAADWAGTVAAADKFLATFATAVAATDKEKNYQNEAAGLKAEAQLRLVDWEKLDLPVAVARLKKINDAAQRIAAPRFAATLAAQFNAAWQRLEQRAAALGATATAQQCQAAALNWQGRSEAGIYHDLRSALKAMSDAEERRSWTRAVETGKKLVEFWGDARFTAGSLFQPGKTAADLTTMFPPVREKVEKIFPPAALSAVKDSPTALTDKLNEWLATPYAPHLPVWRAALAAAEINAAGREDVWRQARRLAAAPTAVAVEQLQARAYLTRLDQTSNENLVKRTVIETAYPQALFQRPFTPRLPPPAQFYEQLAVRGYVSEAGREKAAVFVAMLDPLLSLDDARRVFGKNYPRRRGGKCLWSAWQEQLKNAASPEAQAAWQRLLDAVETPLVTLLYGEPDAHGRMVKRDYDRAVATIDTLTQYDAAHPTDDHGGKLPFAAALKNLRAALVFESWLLRAKRAYVDALLNDNDYETAEDYVERLRAFSPHDRSLMLDLAKVYLAEARYADRQKTPRPYAVTGEKNPAALFAQAMVESLQCLRRSPPQSDLWWEAHLLSIEIELSAAEARQKAGLTGEIPQLTVPTTNPATGEPLATQVSLRPTATILNNLAITVRRDLQTPNLSAERRQQLSGFATRLSN